MAQDSSHARISRSSFGGAFARALLIILGTTLLVFGVLLVLATALLSLDSDSDYLLILPFALITCAGGIAIVASQARPVSSVTRQGAAAGTGQPAATTVAATAAPQPAATPAALPAIAVAQQAPVQEKSAAPAPAEDVAQLVHRSSDLFATLRDLVRHEQASATPTDKRHLATMLQAAGLMEWPDAPACQGGRLTRNNHFWIRLSVDNLDDTQYDTLVTTEAALGVNQDLPDVCRQSLTGTAAQKASLALMRSMCQQTIQRPALVDDGLRACYHTTDDASHEGDWVVRSLVCNAAESVRVPFRVVYDVHVNMDTGLVTLSLEIPRPRCMAIFSTSSTTQASLARAYAFRLAVLLASHAFDASSRVRRVVVNCHEHAAAATLVSLDLEREIMDTMRSVATSPMIEEGFPTDRRIRASFSGRWFTPVEPFVEFGSLQTMPQRALVFPELLVEEAPQAIASICHAKRICDLGINENASRVSTWNSIRTQLGSSTEQAVSTLLATRDAADDITVAEACNRTAQALVEGTADLDDLLALGSLFVDGSALDRAVAKAMRLLDNSENPDAEGAVKVLEDALAPLEDMGAYLDDETSVYRYYGSVSERIQHNASVDEGGRMIRLVPDAYFNAHSNASIALGMLGRNDEALAHADICMRLAPTSTYATMRKVRVLEAESRIYEAADLIVAALRHAVTPRDAAICHYRLAYMEWKLGREDLAAACYQRSLTWDTEMSAQAQEELDDLLSSSPNLERLTSEQADALLAREGIPLGCVRTDADLTLAAAVACMDNAVFLAARPLMAVLFGMSNDDVVMGVYRSLAVPV